MIEENWIKFKDNAIEGATEEEERQLAVIYYAGAKIAIELMECNCPAVVIKEEINRLLQDIEEKDIG